MNRVHSELARCSSKKKKGHCGRGPGTELEKQDVLELKSRRRKKNKRLKKQGWAPRQG